MKSFREWIKDNKLDEWGAAVAGIARAAGPMIARAAPQIGKGFAQGMAYQAGKNTANKYIGGGGEQQQQQQMKKTMKKKMKRAMKKS